MKNLSLNLEGVVFTYDGDNYLAHSECVDNIVSALGLGEVVIIGPVEWSNSDICAYNNCSKN